MNLTKLLAIVTLAGCVAEPIEDIDTTEPGDPTSQEGRTGTVVLHRDDGATATVQYVVHDGHMIWQGDIDLGPAPDPRLRALPTVSLGKRWTDATVYYEIDASASSMTTMIDNAAAYYTSRTPLKFVKGKVANKPYLEYVSTSGTSHSAIGMQAAPSTGDPWQRGTVYLNAPNDDGGQQIVVHETGHAMGFHHEQQREDRPSYLTYDESCVEPGMEGNFAEEKWSPAGDGVSFGDYDIVSVMEYGSWQICDNSGSTASPAPPSWATRKNCVCYPLWKNGYASNDPNGMVIPSIYLSKEDVNALWHMYEPTLGINEAGDEFGNALASADFDLDGYPDLAVGVPFEQPENAGVVFLYKGTRTGLVAWTWFTSSSLDAPQNGDRFGTALTAGDVTGDGYPDLIVGAPRRYSNDAGAVYVYAGGSTGVHALAKIDQATLGGSNESDDHFGTSLAIGNFDNSGKKEIAIGARNKEPGSDPASGFVYIAHWSGSAFTLFDWIRPSEVSGVTSKAGMDFGAALAVGDFNHDNKDDLAVGSPEESVSGGGSGAVYIFLGGTSGMTAHSVVRPSASNARFGAALAVGTFDGNTWGSGTRASQLAIGAPYAQSEKGRIYVYRSKFTSSVFNGIVYWNDFGQSGAGLNDNQYDHLGQVLVAGDFDGDGRDGLLAGVPDETYSGANDSGAVLLYYGTSTGLDGSGTHFWQPNDNAADDRFGNALAVGDFSGNGLLDFCVGAPGEANGSGAHAGGFSFYNGRADGTIGYYSFHDQASGQFQ